MKRSGILVLMAMVLIAVVPLGCATVSGTGRRQLMLLSESEEAAQGRAAWQEICRTEKASSDRTKLATVKRVGSRIAAVSGRSDYQWQFALFASDSPNAFALPGGYVAVYDSLFNYVGSDAELAAVMGHEVAHVLCRHSGERLSQNAAGSLLGEVVSAAAGKNRESVSTAYNAAAQLGVLLPYSRKQELEADYQGLLLMARAGYDPAAALRFWEKFGRLGSGSRLEAFLSTHPASSERIAELRRHLPEAQQRYRQAVARQ